MDKKRRALLPLEAQWQHFSRCLDVGYAYRLARRMEEFRSNPVLGYRTAGSKAEAETGNMLYEEMVNIGLNPKKERFPVDGWEFSRACLFYRDKSGQEQACDKSRAVGNGNRFFKNESLYKILKQHAGGDRNCRNDESSGSKEIHRSNKCGHQCNYDAVHQLFCCFFPMNMGGR
jgi:hypothetical protein